MWIVKWGKADEIFAQGFWRGYEAEATGRSGIINGRRTKFVVFEAWSVADSCRFKSFYSRV
jgi:hypothetical protein